MIDGLVTIIVLVYNNKKYLYEALDSILGQSYERIEIIVNDDCSNNFEDKDILEIRNYIEKNKKYNLLNFIVTKNPRNIGVVRSYNKCITISQGQYIMHLASDDMFYDYDVVSNVINYFKNNDELIVTTDLMPIITEGTDIDNKSGEENYQKVIQSVINSRKDEFGDNARQMFLSLCGRNFIPGANTYYKRELIYKYGLYDEDYVIVDDWPRWLSLTRRGCNIGFLDIKGINYRIGGVTTGSTTTVTTENQNSNINNVIQRDYWLASEKEISPFWNSIFNSLEYYKDNIQKDNIIERSKKNNYSIICYWRVDSGFYCEENTVKDIINPYLKSIKKTFDMRSVKDISEIRFDPINCRCSIKINEIYTLIDNEKIDIPIKYINNHTIYEDIYFFDTNDPNIYLDISQIKIDYLYVDFEILSYDGVLLN